MKARPCDPKRQDSDTEFLSDQIHIQKFIDDAQGASHCLTILGLLTGGQHANEQMSKR